MSCLSCLTNLWGELFFWNISNLVPHLLPHLVPHLRHLRHLCQKCLTLRHWGKCVPHLYHICGTCGTNINVPHFVVQWGLRIEVCEGWQLRCTEVYEVQWGAWWEIVRDGNWGALRCMRCNPHINHPKVGCLGWLGCIYEIIPFWGVPYSMLLTPYSLLLTPSRLAQAAPRIMLPASKVPHFGVHGMWCYCIILFSPRNRVSIQLSPPRSARGKAVLMLEEYQKV